MKLETILKMSLVGFSLWIAYSFGNLNGRKAENQRKILFPDSPNRTQRTPFNVEVNLTDYLFCGNNRM